MFETVERTRHRELVSGLIQRHPVVAIVGARQVGKTTLARQIVDRWAGSTSYYDLENPSDLARLEDPILSLGRTEGLVVVDEVQRKPDLFASLRVLVDRPDNLARFLILGSASPELLRQSSESLAGRIAYHTLPGFSIEEVGFDRIETLWLRGGYPRSFLAGSEPDSTEWRREFIRTYLERDLPQLGIQVPAQTLRRFWTMLAHYHAQTWNAAELARALGVSGSSVRRYLDTLTSTFVVLQLQPWHENLLKRQVKSPKVYLSDTGLLHTLLGLTTADQVGSHPKVGASWEGFALTQLVWHIGARPEECFFWATHAGAELDLLVVRGNRRLGFDFKYTSSPATRRSMHVAAADIRLDELVVIHPGEHSFPLTGNMRAVALRRVAEDLEPLRP